MSRGVAVHPFLEHVEFVRKNGQGANIAEAYAVLHDDADSHEFKVAIPRHMAHRLAKFLAGWDDADETPRITFTIASPKDQP